LATVPVDLGLRLQRLPLHAEQRFETLGDERFTTPTRQIPLLQDGVNGRPCVHRRRRRFLDTQHIAEEELQPARKPQPQLRDRDRLLKFLDLISGRRLFVDPAELPQDVRYLIANRLEGIDVVELDGAGEKVFRNSMPRRLTAKLPTFEALLEAIRGNEKLVMPRT
jgi:hypothetical protein